MTEKYFSKTAIISAILVSETYLVGREYIRIDTIPE